MELKNKIEIFEVKDKKDIRVYLDAGFPLGCLYDFYHEQLTWCVEEMRKQNEKAKVKEEVEVKVEEVETKDEKQAEAEDES